MTSAAAFTPQAAAAALLKRREARTSLAAFARAQGFAPAPHHLLLIAELEALARGDVDFLLVEMPPGSAKSTYVNFLFPAWYLGTIADRPGSDVLTSSHSSELAERWGRKTRNLVASCGPTLGIGLSSDSTAAYRWSTTAGSEFYAVGVGVGIWAFAPPLGSSTIPSVHGRTPRASASAIGFGSGTSTTSRLVFDLVRSA